MFLYSELHCNLEKTVCGVAVKTENKEKLKWLILRISVVTMATKFNTKTTSQNRYDQNIKQSVPFCTRP